MTQALELIVRTGEMELFSDFTSQHTIDEGLRSVKEIETQIYGAIKLTVFDGIIIDFDQRVEYLSDMRFKDYFDTTTNFNMLKELLDGFSSKVEGMSGRDENQKVADLIGIGCIAGAIRRNLQNPELADSMKRYVESCYMAITSEENTKVISNGDHYFSLLSSWSDLISHEEIARKVITRTIHRRLPGFDDSTEDFYYTLGKLEEMTNRATISRIVYLVCSELDPEEGKQTYDVYVKDGKVDDLRAGNGFDEKKIVDAVKKYENHTYTLSTLREKVGMKARTYIGLKMGEWMQAGKSRLIRDMVNNGPDMYDEEVAKRSLTIYAGIILATGELHKLDFILAYDKTVTEGSAVSLERIPFPANLIDMDNLAIKPLVAAYQTTLRVLGSGK